MFGTASLVSFQFEPMVIVVSFLAGSAGAAFVALLCGVIACALGNEDDHHHVAK